MLARDPSRKSWCVYFSFKEFGQELLSHDALWFIGGVLRQDNVDEITGGFGTAFSLHLRLFFTGMASMRTGIFLETPFGSCMIFAELGKALADTAGIKFMFDLTGPSGHKPCGKCRNVVNTRSNLALAAGGLAVDHTCTDPRKFVKHTEASFNSVCARVERSGITERKNLQTRLGVMYNPHVIINIILKNNG